MLRASRLLLDDELCRGLPGGKATAKGGAVPCVARCDPVVGMRCSVYGRPYALLCCPIPCGVPRATLRSAFLLRCQKKVTKEKAALPHRPSGSLRSSPNRAAAQLVLRAQAVLADYSRFSCGARRLRRGGGGCDIVGCNKRSALHQIATSGAMPVGYCALRGLRGLG